MKIIYLILGAVGLSWLYWYYAIRKPNTLEVINRERAALNAIGTSANTSAVIATPPMGTLGAYPLTGMVITPAASQPPQHLVWNLFPMNANDYKTQGITHL